MSFDFNPETKEIKLINSKEIVDKKSNADIEEKTENDIELIGNSLKFSDKALDTIGLIVDDRILIKYDKLFGVLRPIIGKEDSFDCKGGNKILKNKTISFRGFQNDMLKEFGNKFNLIAGLKRMLLSPETLIRMGKSVLLAFFIGLAPWIVIKSEMLNVLALYHFTAQGIATYMLTLAATMVKYALLPMIIIALVDAWYTRWSYNENLKMTKNEVKDERKQAEGDEKVKAKIRQKMMKMSMRHIAQEVPRADVIITNPTHIAVALRYDADEAPAPLVLAMGANHMAE